MSYVDQRPVPTYNSLTDAHLTGYFANTRLQRHLQKSGLIKKNGEIVSENMYRINVSRKEHKRQLKDMLAQAIVHKSLDLERARQAEIRNVLEQIAKIQLVRRVRESRSKNKSREHLPGVAGSRPSSSPYAHDSSSHSRKDAHSAPPGKGKRSLSAHSSSYEDEFIVYLDDGGRPLSPQHLEGISGRYSTRGDARHVPLDAAALQKYVRLLAQMDQGQGEAVSPYLIPQFPLPPKSPRSGNSSCRPTRYRSAREDSKTCSTKGPERVIQRIGSPKRYQAKQGTRCEVHMHYHGSSLSLARESLDKRQDILVEQQHCGGSTLTVFSARLEPDTKFSFVSHHYRGYPFSLTFYVDGKMVSRVSTCCEYRHHKGARVGGKAGQFSITRIVGAVPCYKCQVERAVKRKGQRPQSKAKQPTQDQEEVTVEKQSRPVSAKKISHKKAPETRREKLVPVDNIDDQKGDDIYDDDFEPSSSHSSDEEEDHTCNKGHGSDDLTKESETARRQPVVLKNHIAGQKCTHVFRKRDSLSKEIGHRSSGLSTAREDYSGGTCTYFSNTLHSHDTSGSSMPCSSDTTYCGDSLYPSSTSYLSESSQNGHCCACKMMLFKNEEGRENFKVEDYSLVERISETDPSHTNVRESIAGTKRDNHRETPTRKKIPSLKTSTDQPTVFNCSSRSTSLISSCAANEAGDTVDEVSDFESEIDSPKLETDACKLSGGCSDFDVTNSKNSNIVEENMGKSNKVVSKSKDCMYNRSNSFVCEIGCKKRAGKNCYSRVQGEITNVNSKKTKNTTAGIVSGDDKRPFLANNKHRTTNCHKIRISGNMLQVSSSCLVKSLYLDLCVTASSCSDKPLKTENVNPVSVTESMHGQSMDLVKEQIEVRNGCEREYEDGAAKRICRGCSRRSRHQDARCKGKRPHVMVDNGISGEESYSSRKNKNVGKLTPELRMRKAKHNATRSDKMVVNERKPNKHQKKLKFDGNITSIPMTRTGENRHLIKQAHRDAEEKRSSALKKSLDESHGKGFKDLSPPIRIIRGYAGESISDSDKDEIYSELQLHDKETSLSGQSYHKKGQHSTVEVDDSSVKVKDTPQCLVLVHTDKETIGHKTVKEDNTDKASGILENKFSNNVKDESELTGIVRLDVSVRNRDDTSYMPKKDCIGFHQTVNFNSATHETESSVRYKTCVHEHDAEDSSDSDNGTTHLSSKFIFPHLSLSYAKPSVDEMAQSPVSDVHDLVSVQSCVSERILPDYVKPLEYEFSKTGKEGSTVEDKMTSTEVIPASNEDTEDQSSVSRQNKANHLTETIGSEAGLLTSYEHIHDVARANGNKDKRYFSDFSDSYVTSDAGNERKEMTYHSKKEKERSSYFKETKSQDSRRTTRQIGHSSFHGKRSIQRHSRYGEDHRAPASVNKESEETSEHLALQTEQKRMAKDGDVRHKRKTYHIPVTVDVEDSDRSENRGELSLNLVLKVHSSRDSQDVERRAAQQAAEKPERERERKSESALKKLTPPARREEHIASSDEHIQDDVSRTKAEHFQISQRRFVKSTAESYRNDHEHDGFTAGQNKNIPSELKAKDIKEDKEPLKAVVASGSRLQKNEDGLKRTSSVSSSASSSSISSSVSTSSSSSSSTSGQTYSGKEEKEYKEKKASDVSEDLHGAQKQEAKNLEDIKDEVKNLKDMKDEVKNVEDMKNEVKNLEVMKDEVKNMKDMKDEIKNLEGIKDEDKNYLEDVKDDVKDLNYMQDEMKNVKDMKDEMKNLKEIKHEIKHLEGIHSQVTVDSDHERSRSSSSSSSSTEEAEDVEETRQQTKLILNTNQHESNFLEEKKEDPQPFVMTSFIETGEEEIDSEDDVSEHKLEIIQHSPTRAPIQTAKEEVETRNVENAGKHDSDLASDSSSSLSSSSSSCGSAIIYNPKENSSDTGSVDAGDGVEPTGSDTALTVVTFDHGSTNRAPETDPTTGSFGKGPPIGASDENQQKGAFDKDAQKSSLDRDPPAESFDRDPGIGASDSSQTPADGAERFRKDSLAEAHTAEVYEDSEVQPHVKREDVLPPEKKSAQKNEGDVMPDPGVVRSRSSDDPHLAQELVGDSTTVVQGTSDPVLLIQNVKLEKAKLQEFGELVKDKEKMRELALINCNLDDNSFKEVVETLKDSASNPVILNFSRNALTAGCIKNILDLLQKKPSIEALILRGNRLGDAGVMELVNGILKLHNEKVGDSQKDGRSNGLRELDLTDCGIGDEGAGSMTQLIRSKIDIDTLNLSSNTAITTAGWVAIGDALGENRSLETLTLDHNAVGDEGMRRIAKGLYNNRSITALDLNFVGMSEKGGECLMNLLKRNVTIIEINLKGNDISQQLSDDIQKYISLNKSMVGPRESTEQEI